MTCQEWLGGREKDGYGILSVRNHQWRAHRWVWTQKVGEIPPGLMVLHRCHNRACVNIDHLYLGNNSDNMRDRAATGWKPTPEHLSAMGRAGGRK